MVGSGWAADVVDSGWPSPRLVGLVHRSILPSGLADWAWSCLPRQPLYSLTATVQPPQLRFSHPSHGSATPATVQPPQLRFSHPSYGSATPAMVQPPQLRFSHPSYGSATPATVQPPQLRFSHPSYGSATPATVQPPQLRFSHPSYGSATVQPPQLHYTWTAIWESVKADIDVTYLCSTCTRRRVCSSVRAVGLRSAPGWGMVSCSW